ncbi:MAG: tetratricopeptide repeat protein [Candidatus Longimicrobiales bacterium M2_2A_002]
MSLLNRLKEARIIRVLLVYLGASWVVIEAADLLQEELGLPDWVVPVALILVLVGAVVVLATAWVQAQPATDRREAAGEVPTDWELALGDLARSLKGGQLPHLTWGRAIGGGVVAFLALFGLASLLMPGDDGVIPELRADPAAPAVAVLPFRASGPDLETWREGMVDLLSRNLDGLGGLRAIDSRTVLARWSEVVGDGGSPDLATALSVAGRTGARWALVGSAVEVGPRVRLSADVYEVETGRRLDGASAEGRPDSLFGLVDGLSVDVARALIEREDPDLSTLRLANITTESPEALRRFLEGESLYRRLAFREAIDAYERAVALDPEFALAYYRLGTARGWLALPTAFDARLQAYEHRDRLPEREALLVEAEYRSRAGALPSGVALLREGVRRFPDDPEIWYQLGDIYIHYGPQLLVSPMEAGAALERAVELDPGFAPYGIHLVELTMVRGDSAEAARMLEREIELAGEGVRYVRSHRLLFDYIYGTDARRAAVVAGLDTLPDNIRRLLEAPIALDGEAGPRWFHLANAACGDVVARLPTMNPYELFRCMWIKSATGRIDEVSRVGDVIERSGRPVMAAVLDFTFRQTGIDPDAPTTSPDTILAASSVAAGEGIVNPDLFIAGIFALERGRPAVKDSITGVYLATADSLDARGDTLDARLVRGLARGLDGLEALTEERPDTALDRLEQARELLAGSTGPENAFATLVVWPLAELYERVGRDRKALALYESLWFAPQVGPALIRQAEIHERLGEPARADTLYARFLDLWSEADPEHPLVQRAREAIGPG